MSGVLSMFAAAAAACKCIPQSPAEGFDKAQYVFTGTIVEAERHLWQVAVDRVWKGRAKLTPIVRLMDAHAATSCEQSFELGRSYLFYASLGKGVLGKNKALFFHPRICSWTSPLKSRSVTDNRAAPLWIEDLVIREHGPGELPQAMSGHARKADPSR